MAKRFKFEDGDVFEIFLSKKALAYCRVIGRNQYGSLFELYEEKFEQPQEIDALKANAPHRLKVIFINEHSLKNKEKARFVGNIPLSSKEKQHPPIFQGSPGLFWKVIFKDKIEGYTPDQISYEELLRKGYVASTIFSTEAIVEFYLRNKPLVFAPHFRTNGSTKLT